MEKYFEIVTKNSMKVIITRNLAVFRYFSFRMRIIKEILVEKIEFWPNSALGPILSMNLWKILDSKEINEAKSFSEVIKILS